MNNILEVIHAIRATSSKNEKLALLMSNKDNDDLRTYLRMTYEPRINFYVKSVTSSPTGGTEEFTDDTIAEVYDTIAKRELTGNAAREWLTKLDGTLDSDGRELLDLLIRRDIKSGVSAGTINKVWPDLITDPPYMRCGLPRDADLVNWPWSEGVYSQIKADGMFANISIHNSSLATVESRAGSPFPIDAFSDLVKNVLDLVPPGHQLHGELLMLDKSGKILPREVGNGMFNSLLKDGELEPGYRPIYQVWDIIPLNEAKAKNKYKVEYKTRFDYLIDLFKDSDMKFIQVIEYEIVYSLAEAYASAGRAMARGLEGTVIKHPNAIWEDTTSKNQIKLKLEFEVDLRVKSLKAADPKSKNAATFGSMECESECGLLQVSVTGLKDDKRQYIFDNFEDEYKDGIITVRANGVMMPNPDTGGKYSLFLPRYVEDRADKTEADTLERILSIQQAAIDMVQISK